MKNAILELNGKEFMHR